MKLASIRKLAIALVAIASIGAGNTQASAASKDTAAKTTAAAIHQQTDQGTLAQFDSAKEGTTTFAIIGDKEGTGATTTWTHAGNQVNIGATLSGDTTIAGVVNKDGLVTKTTNGNTAKDATNTGTAIKDGLQHGANEVFTGVTQAGSGVWR